MRKPEPLLQERPQSGFPVSIGTGLALETVFEPTQDVFDAARAVPDRPEATRYTDYLFNVATVLRNLLTSIPYKDLRRCHPVDVISTMMEEVDYLKTLFSMEDKRLHFYINSYAFVQQNYKDRLRTATTEQQIYSHQLAEQCIKHFKKTEPVLLFSKDVHLESSSSALVLTHVPWDLLSHHRFRRLDLLESHTGVIKTRKDWNTKYFKFAAKDMGFLPFMEYLLTTFGDNVMFKPKSVKDREALYESLLKKRVHPLMSELSLMTAK